MTPSPARFLTARHYAVLTAAFLVFVFYGSLVPLRYVPLPLANGLAQFGEVMSQGVTMHSKSDWAANVALFVPLGFLAAATMSVDRPRNIYAVGLIPLFGILSASIELTQIWFPDRNSNINDVVAETIGGAIGVGGWYAIGQTLTDRIRSAWSALGPGDWAAKAFLPYLLFLVIAHGMPFDLTASPYQLHQKYLRGLEPEAEAEGYPQIAVLPFSKQLGEKTLLNIVYFLPVGVLLAGLPGRRWRGRGAEPQVFGACLAVAAAVEGVQLLVLSCGAYGSDVISAALAGFGGWWLAVNPARTRPSWQIAAGIAWLAGMCVAHWWPYDIRTEHLRERLAAAEWVPFADYQAGNYLLAFNRILNKAMLFVPVGYLLGQGVRGWWFPAVLGLGFSAFVEFGQGLMSEHRPGLSDVFLGGIGAAIGGLLARRLPNVTAGGGGRSTPEPRFFYGGVADRRLA